MARILVVDLGTTYFKFTLFDRTGRLCDTRHLAPPVRGVKSGYMELDAGAFEDLIVRGIAELKEASSGGLADVETVTFATQTNSFVLLDTVGRPLTPIILWPDRRAADVEPEVRRLCENPEFATTTGIPQVSCQFMMAKLLWLEQHLPEIWKQIGELCLVSDYLTRLLADRHSTEAGAAGLTGLLDVHRCRWSPKMLARFEIDERWLPEIVRAGTDLGCISVKAAQKFRLPETCRCIVGCLDQYAGAIGAGCVEPGLISETTGTVLATVQCADRFATDLGPSVFQGPTSREGFYWRMAFGDVSANYLQWYRNQLPHRPEFDELASLAGQVEPGAGGLKLRTDVPLNDGATVFEGMTDRHTSGHAVRCIMEAVAGSLRDQVRALSPHGLPPEIRSTGGAARSNLWLQIKADILGTAIRATECPEPTSLGAAIIAEATLSGKDVSQVAQQWVHLKPTHQPSAK